MNSHEIRNTLRAVENTHNHLRHQLELWQGEYKAYGRRTALTKKDIAWLERRVARLANAIDRLGTAALEAEEELAAYTARW